MNEGDGSLIRAQRATKKKILQAQAELLPVSIPPVERQALDVEAIPSVEADVQRAVPKPIPPKILSWLFCTAACRFETKGLLSAGQHNFAPSHSRGTAIALFEVMMRGYITEIDFDKVDEAFPGIVRYYRELKDKPCTFLELVWGFTHRDGVCPETVPVASKVAIGAVVR